MGEGLECSEDYCVPAKVLYDVFLSEKDLTKLHLGARAYMEKPHVGEQFSLMNGNVTGKILNLKENSEIVHKWRFSDWKEGDYSTVTIKFITLEEELTQVSINQKGIPSADKFGNRLDLDTYKAGWKLHFLDRLSLIFGFPKP